MGHLRDLPEMRRQARALATDQGDVVCRDELTALGVDDRMVRREVAAGRWRLHGRQTVAVHTGGLGERGLWWRAVWETGARIAALDGVSSLRAAGLSGFEDELVHVSVRHTATVATSRGVTVHKVIRRTPGELLTVGVPRTRPAVAAVRAAHWAVSNRQAALLLILPVQQRLVTPAQLLDATSQVRGRTRRAFIRQVTHDIADGAHSLGELDFAGMCRRRGLPEPSRQVVRRGPRGRIYLDAGWEEIGLAVEIDGAGHRAGLAVTDDNLRQNEIVLGGELVLRIDLVGLRVAGEQFLDQVCAAYARRSRRSDR